jgi:cytochrome c-type biogenesis protein CcmH/NrfG
VKARIRKRVIQTRSVLSISFGLLRKVEACAWSQVKSLEHAVQALD